MIRGRSLKSAASFLCTARGCVKRGRSRGEYVNITSPLHVDVTVVLIINCFIRQINRSNAKKQMPTALAFFFRVDYMNFTVHAVDPRHTAAVPRRSATNAGSALSHFPSLKKPAANAAGLLLPLCIYRAYRLKQSTFPRSGPTHGVWSGHKVAHGGLRGFSLVEHLVDLRGDRHVDPGLLRQLVRRFGGRSTPPRRRRPGSSPLSP